MSRDLPEALPGTHKNLPDVLPIYPKCRDKATRKVNKISSSVQVKQSFPNKDLVSSSKNHGHEDLDQIVNKSVNQFQYDATKLTFARKTRKGDSTTRRNCSSNSGGKGVKQLIKRNNEVMEKPIFRSCSKNNTNRKEPFRRENEHRKDIRGFIDDLTHTKPSQRPVNDSSQTLDSLNRTISSNKRDKGSSDKDDFVPRTTSTPKVNKIFKAKVPGKCGTDRDPRNEITPKEFLQCLKKHEEDTNMLLDLIKSNSHLMKDSEHTSEEMRKISCALNSISRFANVNRINQSFASNQFSTISGRHHRDPPLKSIETKQVGIFAVISKEKILDIPSKIIDIPSKILDIPSKSKAKKSLCSFTCALNGTSGLAHNKMECENCSASHRVIKGNVLLGSEIGPQSEETCKSELIATEATPKILPGSIRGNVEFPGSGEKANVHDRMQSDKMTPILSGLTNCPTLNSKQQNCDTEMGFPVTSAKSPKNNNGCKNNRSCPFQGLTVVDHSDKMIIHNDTKSKVNKFDGQLRECAPIDSSEMIEELSRGVDSKDKFRSSATKEVITTSHDKQKEINGVLPNANMMSNCSTINCEKSSEQACKFEDKASSAKCETESKETEIFGPEQNENEVVGITPRQNPSRENNVLKLHAGNSLSYNDKHVSCEESRNTAYCDEENFIQEQTRKSSTVWSDSSLSESPYHSSPSPEIQDDGKKRKKSSKSMKKAYFKKNIIEGGRLSLEKTESEREMLNQQLTKEKLSANSSSKWHHVDGFCKDLQNDRAAEIVLPNRDRWLRIGGDNTRSRKEFCRRVGTECHEKKNVRSGKHKTEEKRGKVGTDATYKRCAYRPEYLEAVSKHKAILRRKMGLCKELKVVSNVADSSGNSKMGKAVDHHHQDLGEALEEPNSGKNQTKVKSDKGECRTMNEQEQSTFSKFYMGESTKDRQVRIESQEHGTNEDKTNHDADNQDVKFKTEMEQNFKVNGKSHNKWISPPFLSYRTSQKEKLKISSRIWKAPRKFSRYATLKSSCHIQHQDNKNSKKAHNCDGVTSKKGINRKFSKVIKTKQCWDNSKISLKNEDETGNAGATATKNGAESKKRQTMSSMSARIWEELLKETMLSSKKETSENGACHAVKRTSYELKRLLHRADSGIQGAERAASRCWMTALDEVNQIIAKPKRSIMKNRVGRNIGQENDQSERRELIYTGTRNLESLTEKMCSNATSVDVNKPIIFEEQADKLHPQNSVPFKDNALQDNGGFKEFMDRAGKLTLNQRADDTNDPPQEENVSPCELDGNNTKRCPAIEATNEKNHAVEQKNLLVSKKPNESNLSSNSSGVDEDKRNNGKSGTKGHLHSQVCDNEENDVTDYNLSTCHSGPHSPQDIFDFSWHSDDFSTNGEGEKVFFQNNIYHVEVETTVHKGQDNYNLQNAKECLEDGSSLSKSTDLLYAVSEEDPTKNCPRSRESSVAEGNASDTFGIFPNYKDTMSDSTIKESKNIGKDTGKTYDNVMQETRCRVTTEDGDAVWIQVDDLNYF